MHKVFTSKGCFKFYSYNKDNVRELQNPIKKAIKGFYTQLVYAYYHYFLLLLKKTMRTIA